MSYWFGTGKNDYDKEMARMITKDTSFNKK